MKLSKKLRLLLSIASLLVCVFTIPVSASALDAEQTTVAEEETTLSAEDSKTYIDGSVKYYDVRQKVSEFTQIIASMEGLSKDDVKFIADYQNGAQGTLFVKDFAEKLMDGINVKYVDHSISMVEENDDKSLSVFVTIMLEGQSMDVKLTIKNLAYCGLQITEYDFGDTAKNDIVETTTAKANEDEESFGSKMTTAAGNTAMGMGTVFVVLIVISLIIYGFELIPKIQAMFQKKSDAPASEEVAQSTSPVAVENLTDDLELVAVISAAIAASEETTTDGFVVRSIRRR